VTRCFGEGDEVYAAYHDEEWGRPLHDDRALFELLILEGFQAGLSWSTILRKRENFRKAFDGFDPERIAAYGLADAERLLGDAGIVRNRAKIEATIRNARASPQVTAEFGSLDAYLWKFTGGDTLQKPAPKSWSEVPATSPESDQMSKDLRKRGFSFVGSTICYAFMQAAGMVNDHLASCPLAIKAG
jgi:DNA-3-methyladenine glycosylase I